MWEKLLETRETQSSINKRFGGGQHTFLVQLQDVYTYTKNEVTVFEEPISRVDRLEGATEDNEEAFDGCIGGARAKEEKASNRCSP